MVEDQYTAAPRKSGGRWVLALVLLAFIGGALLAAWLTSTHKLDAVLPAQATAPPAIDAHKVATIAPPSPGTPSAAQTTGVPALEARLAMLEERLSRINTQADASLGNTARAEGLLIAFAARRLIDRGTALGPVAEQLRLRFGDAQPRAIQALIDGAGKPVTLGDLTGELDALAPRLEKPAGSDDIFGRIGRQFTNLFVVRSDNAPASTPEQRLTRARLLLQSGKVDEAVAEVGRLPGSASATGWIARARHYGEMQRALDLIETTAMLEPRGLNDAAGHTVNQTSPLARPTPVPTPQSAESGVPEATF